MFVFFFFLFFGKLRKWVANWRWKLLIIPKKTGRCLLFVALLLQFVIFFLWLRFWVFYYCCYCPCNYDLKKKLAFALY